MDKQEKIDTLLSKLELPITLKSIEKIGDEICLAEDSGDNDPLKIFFYFPIVLSRSSGKETIADLFGLQNELKRYNGFIISDIQICDKNKTMTLVFGGQVEVVFDLPQNNWRVYKQDLFHIECFDDDLDIWTNVAEG